MQKADFCIPTVEWLEFPSQNFISLHLVVFFVVVVCIFNRGVGGGRSGSVHFYSL